MILKYQTTLLAFVLLLITIVAWYTNVQYIDLKIAANGFSPYEWITILNNKYIVNIGYPSGTETYTGSLFMYIYKYADFIGIDISLMMKIIIGLEYIITLIGIYFLVKILFFDLKKWKRDLLVFIIYLYFIVGYGTYPELSRFTPSFTTGLYYKFADAFRFLAIASFFNKKYILAGLMLSISFVTHPIYGLLAGVFILVALSVRFKDIQKQEFKNIAFALTIFIVVSILWYLNIFTGEEASYVKMPNDEWYFFALFGNYHWFPIEFGIFSTANEERLIGFLTMSLLFLYSLSTQKKLTIIEKQLFYGWLAMLILAVIGLLISWYKPSPMLTKIALTRASFLAIEISIIYIVYRLVSDLFDSKTNVFKKSIIIGLILSPFLIKAPFPLYLVLILIIIGYTSKDTYNIYSKKMFYFLIGFLSIIIYLYFNNFFHINSDRYIGNKMILYIVIFSFMFLKFINSIYRQSLLLSILFLSMIIFSYSNINKAKPRANYIKKATAYKALQIWSKENTSKNSLFMIDPSIAYGWRAYSHRASFGTLREWIHVAWLYSGNNKIYQEGIKRFNEYEIDIKSLRYKIRPWLQHYNILRTDIRNKYYNKNEKWFNYLSEKYNIKYIVMDKQYIRRKLNFQISYENSKYVLYKINTKHNYKRNKY